MNKQIKQSVFSALVIAGLFTAGGCSKEELAPVTEAGLTSVNDAKAGKPLVTFKAKNYIIISSGDKLPANLESQTQAANGQLTGLLGEVGIALATSDDPQFAAKASKINGVRSVVRDFTYQGFDPEKIKTIAADNTNPPSTGDSNPYFPLQWGHTAIQAPEAWNTGALGKGVRVAVLDSGFDLTHPDLRANIDLAASVSFVPNEPIQFKPVPGNTFSHGTHVAGTIAAVDNNIGVIGVAPQAQLILIKVLRDAGTGSFTYMMQGILYAVAKNADVINMSLGAGIPRNGKFLDDNGTPDNPADDFIVSDTKAVQELLVAISRITTYATQKGVTVISSAGNDANNGNKDASLVHIPSSMPNVISISATGPMGWALAPLTTNLNRVASYTNYGTSDVTFAAPGGDYMYPTEELITFRGVRTNVWALDMVLSLANGGSYTWSAGTSMAAPHATGVAALIIGKNGGQLDPAKVEAVLRASADDLGKPGRDPYYGHGRVNAYKAVASGI